MSESLPPTPAPAQHEDTVRSLYQVESVAERYLENRFARAWSRLLHETQVRLMNDWIQRRRFGSILELAPGPARLAPDLRGVTGGVMVEASLPMIEVARRRLREKGLEGTWEVKHGNAFDLGALQRTFDLVFTFRFLRHFEEGDRRRLYAEIAARLNPSGILVFDVVNKPVRQRLDARTTASPDELKVYDVTYTADEFRREMQANGFEVLALQEAVRHFGCQSWISYNVQPRLPRLAWQLVKVVEKIPSAAPLEWIAVCRKLG